MEPASTKWTAKVDQTIKEGEPKVTVIFTDGLSRKVAEQFKLQGQTAQSLKSQIEVRRKQLESSYGLIDTIDPNFDLLVTPPEEDPEGPARLKYFTDLNKLNNLQHLVDLKIIEETHPLYTETLTLVQSEFRVSYYQ